MREIYLKNFEIAVKENVPVICYGLRSDFRSHLFEGSKRLLELADSIEEIKTLVDPSVTWQFKTAPTERTGGRAIATTQGRTLGGSSSVNGMIYNRGLASDYDNWAALGNPGWDYASVLPYFRKSQRRIGGPDSVYVGRDGNLPISDNDWKSPVIEAFLAGVHAAGLPKNPDYNGQSQAGAGYMQRAIENGRRVSAAHAFLKPAMRRPGLSVRTDAHVTRIVFENKRAVGVRFESNGRSCEVRARREVILSAGALNTPKLLQLSGVGPGELLQSHGIPVVLDNRAVGQNLQDHYGTRTVVRVRNCLTANNLARWPWLALECMKWVLGRPSILGLASSLAYVFWNLVRESQARFLLPAILLLIVAGIVCLGRAEADDPHSPAESTA